jgi:hypothetical protein
MRPTIRGCIEIAPNIFSEQSVAIQKCLLKVTETYYLDDGQFFLGPALMIFVKKT